MLLRFLYHLSLLAVLAEASSELRKPIQSLQPIQDAVIRTSTHRVNANSRFDIDFTLSDSRRVRLSLEPNHEIIPHGATVNYIGSDGRTRTESIQKHEHKVYKGIAREQQKDGSYGEVGFARITVNKDGIKPLFEGAFTIRFNNHHILLTSNYLRTRKPEDADIERGKEESMVLFKDSDIFSGDGDQDVVKRGIESRTCFANDLISNKFGVSQLGDDIFGPQRFSNRFERRQIDSTPGSINSGGDLTATIGQTAGCPTTRKVALVGVATDCGYTNTFNSSDAVRASVISIMNSASGVFENAFNISLGLQNLTIMDASCPGTVQSTTPWNQACTSSSSITTQLNEFSAWRNTLTDTNSHWTLLTACQTGTAVGLAWVGRACMAGTGGAIQSASSETVAGANVVALTGTEWQVVAHETGHTFGAVHDCDSTTCGNSTFVASGQCCPYTANTCDAGSQFIMNPYTIQGNDQFSPCTVGNICSAFGSNAVNSQCLSDNSAVSTITGQQCGNGIVEEGEQCDCGDQADCASDPCCDGTTCKFTAGSVCDDVNEECCNQCQFASNGTVCRPSTSSCDPQETCSGTAGLCPADITAPDGQACSISNAPSGAGALTCASGQCTSRNLQCMSVMGSLTSGSNDTYACEQTSCTMSCGSPAFGPGTCYQMNRQLLDGTPCGGGGHCSSGTCQGSTLLKEITLWINSNKGIFIPVVVVAGILVLVLLTSCICGCCRRTKVRKVVAPVGEPALAQGWYGPAPPQAFPYGPQPEMEQQGPVSGWGRQPRTQEAGWTPPIRTSSHFTPTEWMPPAPLPPQSPQQTLYGAGIIGSRNIAHDVPHPSYHTPGGDAYSGVGGSQRYA